MKVDPLVKRSANLLLDDKNFLPLILETIARATPQKLPDTRINEIVGECYLNTIARYQTDRFNTIESESFNHLFKEQFLKELRAIIEQEIKPN